MEHTIACITYASRTLCVYDMIHVDIYIYWYHGTPPLEAPSVSHFLILKIYIRSFLRFINNTLQNYAKVFFFPSKVIILAN